MEMPPELVQRFGPLKELGRGACGIVYRLGADRALKVMALTGDGAREARELELAQRLQHPHLMPCFEAGIDGGAAWVVMPLASESMHEVAARPDARQQAWRLLREAARGVAALQAAGVVHRDLKPANVLILDGSARIADFGMARGGDTATLTATGTILGTPQYMAPEQARGERATPAVDAYALGVMAYEIVEGVAPYPEGLGMGELLARVASGRRDPLQRSLTWLPAAARRAIDQALDADPTQRPTDLAAWADDLGELPGASVLPEGEAATEELFKTREAPGVTTDHGTLPPVAQLSLATPGTPAPPATSASMWTRVRRPGLVALAMVLGLAIGVFYQGPTSEETPRPGTTPAPPPSANPPPPGPTEDPGPLAEHPDLAAATRRLDELYQSLGKPFFLPGYDRPIYTSEQIGAHRLREEGEMLEPFKALIRDPNYLKRMREYRDAVLAWVVTARRSLTPSQFESDRVLKYLLDRSYHLYYTHNRTLEFRFKDFRDLFTDATLQRVAQALGSDVRQIILELHEGLNENLRAPPEPRWRVALSMRLGKLGAGEHDDQDIRVLADALRQPASPMTLSHLLSVAQAVRVAPQGPEWPSSQVRWKLWSLAAEALSRYPAEETHPYMGAVLLTDWAFLQEAFPVEDAAARLASHQEHLSLRVLSELDWLEEQSFHPDPQGLPTLPTWPETRRAYQAIRSWAFLLAAWKQRPELADHELGCRLRSRAVRVYARHAGLIDRVLDRDGDGERRLAFRELDGCPNAASRLGSLLVRITDRYRKIGKPFLLSGAQTVSFLGRRSGPEARQAQREAYASYLRGSSHQAEWESLFADLRILLQRMIADGSDRTLRKLLTEWGFRLPRAHRVMFDRQVAQIGEREVDLAQRAAAANQALREEAASFLSGAAEVLGERPWPAWALAFRMRLAGALHMQQDAQDAQDLLEHLRAPRTHPDYLAFLDLAASLSQWEVGIDCPTRREIHEVATTGAEALPRSYQIARTELLRVAKMRLEEACP